MKVESRGAWVWKEAGGCWGFVLYELERAVGIKLALGGRWPLWDQTLNPLCHPANQTLCQTCNFQSGLTLDTSISSSSILPPLSCLYFSSVTHTSYCLSLSPVFAPSACSCHHRPRWARLWEESPATWERWTHDSSVCLGRHDPPPVCLSVFVCPAAFSLSWRTTTSSL